jgi:putative endonuclease
VVSSIRASDDRVIRLPGVIPAQAGIGFRIVQPTQPYVYIMANKPLGTLYIGVTGWLVHRITQHREGTLPGFTCTYRLTQLVWYEPHPTFEAAIRREKQLKRWNRLWKVELIEAMNPGWRDLYRDIAG